MDFYIGLRLNSFLETRIIDVYDDDSCKNRKGIFIPLDVNNLRVSKHGHIYLILQALECKYKSSKGTHIVKMVMKREKIDELNERFGGVSLLVGNMKPKKYF